MGIWRGWGSGWPTLFGWPPTPPSPNGTVEPFDLSRSDTELLQLIAGVFIDKTTGQRLALLTTGSMAGGDASAANQLTEIARLTSILAQFDVALSTRATEATLLAIGTVLSSIESNTVALSGQLPSSLGQKLMAASLAVTLASDQPTINVRVANGASFDIPRFDEMGFTYVGGGAVDDANIATQFFKLSGSLVAGGTLTYTYVGATNNIDKIVQS